MTDQKPSRRRNRWWRRGLIVAVVILGVGASLPWWIPAAVVRMAAGYGVTVGSWESHGWSGVVYRDLVFAQPGVRVQIDSIRVPPLHVAPRASAGDAGRPRIEIGTVDVRVVPDPDRPESEPPALTEVAARVDSIWAMLGRWLPSTRIERAVFEAGGETVSFGTVIWDGASLQGNAAVPSRGIEGVVSIVKSATGAYVAHARLPGRELATDLTIDTRGTSGASVKGDVVWRGNTASLQAEFGPQGMLPTQAGVSVQAVSIPASDVGLRGYEPIHGTLSADWSRDAFTLVMKAGAEPQAGADWPAATVDVRASGDVDRIRIEAIDVLLPSWRATLSRPVEYDFGRGLIGEPAAFSVVGELGAVPRLEAQGHVEGEARIHAVEDGTAAVDFSVHGAGLTWREIEGVTLALAGRWRQPELVIEKAVLDGGGARAEGRLAFDTHLRVVREAHVRAAVPGAVARALSQDLPPFEHLEGEALIEGPEAALRHHGTFEISGLEWTPGRRVGGKAAWTAHDREGTLEGELALAGGGALPFVCRGRREDDGALRGTIERLRWVDDQGEWWHLAEPVVVRYEPGTKLTEVAPWRLKGGDFEIAGEASVRWPAVGDVSLLVSGVDGRRLGGVLPEAIRGSRIERLDLRARWDHGPAELSGAVRATYTPEQGATYAVEGDFTTRGDDLTLGSVRVADASGVVLRGEGRLPLVVEGDDLGFRAAVRREGALSLDLDSEPNPVFWKSIADLTGWTIEDPKLTCRISGTLAAPRGELGLSAVTLRPPSIKLANGGKLPELSGLQVKVVADEAGLALTESMVAIDYRWVTLSGRAGWDVWARWRENGKIEWRRASFELASNPLPIAIASRVFPTELAPVGEVSIKIAHEPVHGLSGQLWLHGAALRPIGPLGSIRDVSSELVLEGYLIHLKDLGGLLGGQDVHISGDADIGAPGHPTFALRLKSSRVPLVRQSGLIVRAELDLELKKERDKVARVTGRVDFGPSLYSADLVELLPGGVESPETRPPYFSIQEKPFADWQLDVGAHGDAFLRLTTPFYKDVLSADVRLRGTMAEPRVEGWVWGTGGVVIFPFGSLPVEQVLVTFTRDDPFEPRLAVSGEGRVMGYDIRMDASGPASEPRLIFASDPPLTSQQVFMMLTTGAVPDESHTIGASDRANRLAMFLGRNLAAGLGLGGGGGGEERLSIRSGEDFTREGRETVLVQYDLDGRWSIVGEYDRFDAYNGGIKFRIINR